MTGEPSTLSTAGFLDPARAAATARAERDRRALGADPAPSDLIQHVLKEKADPMLPLIVGSLKLAISDVERCVDQPGIGPIDGEQVGAEKLLHSAKVVFHLVQALLGRLGHESFPSDLNSDAAELTHASDLAHRLCGTPK